MAKCIRCGRQLPGFSFKKICQWCVQHEAAQRGEIVDEDVKQPVIRAPWVRSESSITLTHVLFGANVAIFLAMAYGSGSVMSFPPRALLFGANYGPSTLTGQWWRLVSYMFLHGGALHIAFNMWCLWDLGALCESLYGRFTFGAIYLITGIAGGLASVAWNPGVLSVGASGAIFGLAGALIASFYLGEFSLPSFAIRGTLMSLVIFAGFNLFFGGVVGGVDNAAHIGGLVSGLILGALIAKVAPQDDALHRASIIGLVALLVVTAGLGVRRWRSPQMRTALSFQALGGSQGDPVARLKMIVQQDPNLAPAHFALAQAYFEQQKFPEAEAEFKRVVELQPKSARARFDLGMTYLSEKRPEEAKAAFSEMLAQGTNTGEAHYGIGLGLAMEEKYQDAVNEFNSAIKDGADVSGIYSEMGFSYAKLKRYDDAIASYLKEKEKSGDNPDLENALADAYQAKGMAKEAQEARGKAAQLRSGDEGH